MQRPQPEPVTLDDILITEELSQRSPGPPNLQAENQALHTLARQLVNQPETMLQTLVDIALDLCCAGTAGVSLLETTPNGEKIFRWKVLAGALAQYVGGTTPRNFSPCGVCLERGTPVLFSHPERYFTYFQAANTPIVEGLVLPLIADNHALGTIWIVSHSEQRHFDAEDVRVMTSLADFTAAALLLNQRQTQELLAKNTQLEAEVIERKQVEEALHESEARLAADLIEQRQAEIALRESESRLQAIANLVPDLLWDSEPDGSTNWYNQRWMEYTGQTFEQAIGWGWTDAIHPDEREGSARRYREAVEQGMPLQQEHRIRRHDGEYRWFVVNAFPLKDETGKVIKMYGAATDIHEARVALEALRESQEKYRALFVSMDEGYAVVEVMADDNGVWNDFLFLEVNPAFVDQTGMEYPVGRKATELLGIPNPNWAQIYGRVAETGEPIRFEEGEATLGRVFDLYVFRLGEDGSRRVAVLFTDISNRKRVEDERKRREEQQQYLLTLSDALRPLSDAAEIEETACRLLGEYLGVNRAYYVELNEAEGYGKVEQQYLRDGASSLAGTYELSAFSWTLPFLRRDETLVVSNIHQTDLIPPTDTPTMEAVEQVAIILVPVVKGGELIGTLAVSEIEPRVWKDEEIELARETLERMWAAAQRARTERALRESEEKYRSLFNSIDAGFCIFEMLYNDAGEAIDFRYIETNPAFERQSGRRPQPGQTMRELFPEAEDMWLKDYAEAARTGQPKRFIDFHEDLDRWFDVFVFPTSNGKNQLAALFSDVTDEKRAEAALRESEERLQKAISIETVGVLFFTLDGHITDANDTFLRMSGYSRDELRTITDWQDLTPPEFWDVTSCAAEELATLGKTAPYEKQHIRKDGSRWWGLFSPTRLKGSGRNAECVEFVIDISDRKQAEAQLSRAAEMDAFRVKLSDALRSLSDAPEIQRAAMRVLGEHLQVDRVMYAEIDDGETYSIAANYVREAYPTLVGRFPTSDFGTVSERLRAGETFAVENMTTDERLSEAARAAFIAFDVYASVGVPLIKAGRWVANLGIQHGQARQWTEEDIKLVQETAERTWAAVERAKAEAALRKSEEKYRSLFESINDGFALLEVLYDDDNRPIDCRFLEVSPSFEFQTGLPQAQGKTLRELIPSVESGWFEHYHQALVTNALVHFEMHQNYLNTWFEVNVFPYGNPQDRRVTIVFRNINERKQAQANQLQLIREQAAREQEHQRAESLAELDRAKTLFFSNVSHEFRTPLTLSLAPLSDALSDRTNPLAPPQRERVELAHRNAIRLLKLVNTLLDFSRIEAGRMEAVYEATDLALFTTELASVFRSAIERAGLRLIVDCPPLPEPVYVDREMWEKIVLNLLSNAFKFTKEGEIVVRLHPADGDRVVLQVQDTGTGIPPEELPHIFERFHQVQRTKARTHEGSGIGLALVHELIRLHGGTVDVSSTVGQGSCFMIAIPLGTAHLPSVSVSDSEALASLRASAVATLGASAGRDSAHRLRLDVGDSPTETLRERITATRTLTSTAIGAAPYVEEVQRWLPAEGNTEELSTPSDLDPPQLLTKASALKRGENLLKVPLFKGDLGGSSGLKTVPTSSPARVLLVDDNADMRDYLTRILSEHVQVEALADGASALAAANERSPDLVLTDVMMPGLDGFELLKALRANPSTREIPIILLSARAGEESVIEGLEAGADDYLIKPFSAQELVSRVNAHLQMSQLRLEALHQERALNHRKDELLSTVSHELNTPLVAILGWTRLLRANPSNQSMLVKALETIERNATLQAKLVQDLLDISRITAGKLRLKFEPVELESVIENAIASITHLADAKGINLVWWGVTGQKSNPLAPGNVDSVLVQGDRDRLQQIIYNILTNAIKFTPDKGSINVELSVIESQNSSNASIAEISITDTGIGISAEFLPHVFDRFRQAQESSSSKGLGLGLAIARHLVELHGCTIHAASDGVGQGATFIVKLPLIDK